MLHRNRWIVLGLTAIVALALPVAALATHAFEDVPDDHSHAEGIDFVAETGISIGCDPEGTRFCPGDDLTRAQMATFLYRASGWDPDTGPVAIAFDTLLVNGQLTFTGTEDYSLEGGASTECAATDMGGPIPMDVVVIDHHLTAVPGDGATSEVNAAVAVDRENDAGEYEVCFTHVHGEDLAAGTYETTFDTSIDVFLAGFEDADEVGPASEGDGVDLDTATAALEVKTAR